MESNKQSTFALFFVNRRFFPATLHAQARQEMPEILKKLGQNTLMMDVDATNHGTVETSQEGEIYANFLKQIGPTDV